MEITNDTFLEIANLKGKKIYFNEPEPIHLDMDMVDASLKMAIQNAKSLAVKEKLIRLQTDGTDAQRVDFVMGEGTYYFPEDLERLAKMSREASAEGASTIGVCRRICEINNYTICKCLGNGDQFCRDFAKKVCTFEWCP